MKALLSVAILIAAIVVCFSQEIMGVYYGPHTSCGREDFISVRDLTFSPHPVEVPGSVTVTAEVQLKTMLNRSMEAQITLQKNQNSMGLMGMLGSSLMGGKNPMSKTFRVGDVCRQLSRHCLRIRPLGLPCTCPVYPGVYGVTDLQLPVPEPSRFIRNPMLQNIVYGEWNVKFELIDSATRRPFFCYEMQNVRLQKKHVPQPVNPAMLQPQQPQQGGGFGGGFGGLLAKAKNLLGGFFG